MSFKSSKGRDAGKGLEVYRSESVGQGIGGGAAGADPVGSLSGGNVNGQEPGNGYKYHTFTGNGTLTVSGGDAAVTILLQGGGAGGGGGPGACGGGGAGGAVLYSVTLEPGTYPITVGAGGGGSVPDSNRGSSGTDSRFGESTPVDIIAKGGGGGGANPSTNAPGGGGGCGGGGGAGNGKAGGTETQSGQNSGLQLEPGFVQFGTPGGTATVDPGNSNDGGGGGGGTGGAGGPGRSRSNPFNITLGIDGSRGGNGHYFAGFNGPLIGVPTLGPLNGYFGGGGGGRQQNLSPNDRKYAPGGLGGGGNANASPGNRNATANSGGGGGTPHAAGSGGSGICVVKVKAQGE